MQSTWDIERENDLATEVFGPPVIPEPIRFKDEYCALKARIVHFGSAGTPVGHLGSTGVSKPSLTMYS